MTIPGVNAILILGILAPIVLIGIIFPVLVAKSLHRSKRIFLVLVICVIGWSISLTLMYTTSSVSYIPFLRNLSAAFDILSYPTIIYFYIIISRSITMIERNDKLIAATLYLIAIIYFGVIAFVFPVNINDIAFNDSGHLFIIKANYVVAQKIYFLFLLPYVLIVLYNTYHTLTHLKDKRNLPAYFVVFIGIVLSSLMSAFIEFVTPLNSVHVAPSSNSLSTLCIVIATGYAIYRFDYYRIDSPKVIRCVLDSISASTILTDPFKKIVYANNCAIELFALEDDYEALALNEIFNNPNYNNSEFSISTNIKAKQLKLTSLIDQSVKYFNLSETTLKDDSGQLYGYFYSFTENTALVESKNKLKSAYDNLEKEIKLRTYDLIHKTDILNTYNNQLRKELMRRKSMEEKIRELAFKDSLTGLDNRRKFIDSIEEIFLKTNLSQSHALVFLDINDFKTLNDNLGRDFGDEILIHTADVLRNYFDDDILLARLGSDEFAIFFTNYGSLQKITDKLIALFNVLSIPQLYDNLTLTTSYSAGIAFFPMHSDSAERLINLAEIACREAKKLGENRFMSFKNEYQVELEQRFRTINKLKRAIAKKEFILHYQPQVVMTEQGYRITGLEALIRWQDGDKLISPGAFIKVAEQSKQIIEIGRFVIAQAIEDISKLNKEYNLSLTLAINISAIQLADEFLYKTLNDALTTYDVDPKLIELELTESVLVSQATSATSLINRFVNLGVKIAVDDFGIEYSSLNYLKTLPINRIKLDMAFIKGIGKSERDETILEIMLQLGNRLNLNVLAEGVETPEQLDFLTSRNCIDIQGYYFHKPMSYQNLIDNNIIGPNGAEHKL